MADEYSWTGNGAAGDWNDPNNWTDITNPSNTGGVPGAGDYVEFDTDAQLNAPGAVGQWIDIEANVSLNGGSITPTEQVGSPLIIGESGTGSLTLTGGATGNIVSSNGNGIVWDGVAIAVLGGSAGTLILTGASTLTTTGAFAGDGTSVITISGGQRAISAIHQAEPVILEAVVSVLITIPEELSWPPPPARSMPGGARSSESTCTP